MASPLLHAQSADPFAIQPDPDAALVGQLRGVTLVTSDADSAIRFFTKAMQMRLVLDATPDESKAAQQRRLWNLPAQKTWRELHFGRPAVPDAIEVRVLVMAGGDPIRPDMQPRLQGGLSLGFPVADQKRVEQDVGAFGVRSTAGIVSMTMPRGDGTKYLVQESHYRGPEELYALGVWREPPLASVGPIEPGLMIGGPSYSGMVVVNSDREVEFYRQVLGWEVRRDIELTASGPGGGLALPVGTRYRFLQLFAPGTVTGYLVMLDFRKDSLANPVTPRAPNRGLVGWTFRTRDLDTVLARVDAYADGRATLLARPMVIPESDGSSRKVASLLTPNGLLLEIEE